MTLTREGPLLVGRRIGNGIIVRFDCGNGRPSIAPRARSAGRKARRAATSRPLALLLVLSMLVAPDARAERTTAPEYLATIQASAELQEFLDRTLEALLASDPALRRVDLRVALLDLGNPDAPRLAHRDGEAPIYPASVIKFVYLMAAY